MNIGRYDTVCAGNPFIGLSNLYGYTAEEYQSYMIAFYGDLPVMNDSAAVRQQIAALFLAHSEEWDMLYKSAKPDVEPDDTYTTETTVTKTGTDNSTNGGTATDKRNTYENATLRDTAQTVTSGTGSVTYNNTTHTTHTDYAGRDPLDSIKKFREISRFSLFLEIIYTVVNGITCRIYNTTNETEETNYDA